MKKILLVLALLGIVSLSNAQIGQTLKEVKERYSNAFSEGFTDSEAEGETLYYVSYEEEMETPQSGSYTRVMAMYFFKNEPDALCAMWIAIEPGSETNPTVNYFNKELVRIKDMIWKDYETNLLYTLRIKKGSCITTCYPDLNNL